MNTQNQREHASKIYEQYKYCGTINHELLGKLTKESKDLLIKEMSYELGYCHR